VSSRLAARFLICGLAWLASACASGGVALAEALRAPRFVLLGEVHDNAVQHRERAELLRALLADGRSSVVVFEQMERSRDADIAAAPRDADAVADAGRLDRAAWRWPLHKPLVDAALAAGATVRGANLARDEVRAIVRDGIAAAPADLRAALAADTAWGAAQESALRAALADGHCGALPADRLPPMALAQRARDAAFALAMLDVPAPARVVLIAGNGHVRRDIGVPHYLRAAGVAPSDIVAVGFIEKGDPDGARFDSVRVTERAERPDPCAAFRR
jgi:uncharacterized iron-regulated protein